MPQSAASSQSSPLCDTSSALGNVKSTGPLIPTKKWFKGRMLEVLEAGMKFRKCFARLFDGDLYNETLGCTAVRCCK